MANGTGTGTEVESMDPVGTQDDGGAPPEQGIQRRPAGRHTSADGPDSGAGRTGKPRHSAGIPSGSTATAAEDTLRPSPKNRPAPKTVVAGAAVATALIAGAVTIHLVNQSVFGPDKPVEAYLDTLVAGDAEASRRLLGTGVGQDALLSDAVYEAAAGRPDAYEVLDVAITDGRATVTTEVTQEGSTSTIAFTLTRTGSTGVLFDQWRLDGPAPVTEVAMVVPEDLQSITVNGAQVALPAGDADRYAGLRSVSLPALPGQYVVSPPSPTTYLSYGAEQTVTVTADPASAPGGVLFEAEATPAVHAEAAAAVTAALDRCIASTEDSPSNCPNASFLFGDPQDVRDPRWTLDEEPTFTLQESYEPGVYRLLSDDAQATFSYERNAEFDPRKPARWEREEDPQRLLISATVTVTGETLAVDLD
ncbi:hypothetical protein MN0502_33240 [Arthrobacter sp. MN05-02]|nr:hypothetical protein MN0502_33240 [Arthrobacter sp. MN05-02]